MERGSRIQPGQGSVTWSMNPSVQSEGGALSGSALGGASFSWASCGLRFSAFDMKVDGGGTGVVANIGGFGDKNRVWDVGATGAPFLDSTDLGPLLVRGLAVRKSWGFELFWQGLELGFGIFDNVLDLFGPGSRVVEGVDHLLEREREF